MKSQSAETKNDPYYLTIANQLRETLYRGEFKPGQRFFSIRQLIQQTGRSLPTVRSAINLLVTEKLLEARPGSGYYVTERVKRFSRGGMINLLAAIPSYTSPKEPFFTGRLVSGMLQAIESLPGVMLSFVQRRMIMPDKVESALRYGTAPDAKTMQADEQAILGANPHGIAWIHASTWDGPTLERLRAQGISLVTTIRRPDGIDLPIVREDDSLFATIVLSQFRAFGHDRIGVILRSLEDDYFGSKVAALNEIRGSFGLTLDPDDFYFLRQEQIPMEDYVEELRKFIKERSHLTALLILASSGIEPLLRIMKEDPSGPWTRLSLVYNVLDGVQVPVLPNGVTLAKVTPPLELMGKQLVAQLVAQVRGERVEKMDRLAPVFENGDSLRRV